MGIQRISDGLFGVVEWDRIEHGWTRRMGHPFYEKCGARIPRDGTDGEESGSRANPEPAAFELVIAAGEYRAEPTAAQRAAWQQYQENEEAIRTTILDMTLAAYQRQRPARAHWWRELHGDDPLLAELMPERMTADELPAFLRPWQFKVHREWPDAGAPVVGILFQTAWDVRGFGVLVRDGRVLELGDSRLASEPWTGRSSVVHPVFGPLRNGEGIFRWEPLRGFYEIAESRKMIRESKPTRLRGSFFPSWDFLEGNFGLEVDDNEVSAQAIAEFQQFAADPEGTARQVLQAIYDHYQSMVDQYHEWLEPEDAAVIMPRIDSVDGLRPLLTFQTLHLSGGADEPFIGLGFHCSWEQEHGLGVRWRQGKVEEVGTADVNF